MLKHQIDCIETKIVRDLLFTHDGKKLVVVYASQTKVSILEAKGKHPLLSEFQETGRILSAKLSRDDTYLLLNISNKKPVIYIYHYKELHLWSMQNSQLLHIYSGFMQNQFLLSCVFVGEKESFVAVGSEGIAYRLRQKMGRFTCTTYSTRRTVSACRLMI